MGKEAISVTLEPQNLLWLRGQVRAFARRSVSEVLDRLVTEARTGGRVESGAIRSVVGTVRLSPDDPDLSVADDAVRRLFLTSRTRSRVGRGSTRRPRGARQGRRPRGG